MALYLGRKVGERILIGEGEGAVVVEVVAISGNKVKLGIAADASVPVRRAELPPLDDKPAK